MAKQFIKDNVIPILTMIIVSVGLVTTAVNTGRASGRLEQKVEFLAESDRGIAESIGAMEDKQAVMETKQAFLEGVVSTKLDNIQLSQTELKESFIDIRKQVDDLVRVE